MSSNLLRLFGIYHINIKPSHNSGAERFKKADVDFNLSQVSLERVIAFRDSIANEKLQNHPINDLYKQLEVCDSFAHSLH